MTRTIKTPICPMCTAELMFQFSFERYTRDNETLSGDNWFCRLCEREIVIYDKV